MPTLAEAKTHLRVDHAEEDAAIQRMIDGALDHMRSIDVDVTADPLPPALHQAALILTATFYDNRGSDMEAAVRVPPAFFRLVAPYRRVTL